MKNKIKCILIDGKNKSISEITVEDNVKKIKNLIGSDSIALTNVTENDDLLTDELGKTMIYDDTPLFKIKNHINPFINSGLIISRDEDGYYCDTKLSVEEVREMVKFFSVPEYQIFMGIVSN